MVHGSQPDIGFCSNLSGSFETAMQLSHGCRVRGSQRTMLENSNGFWHSAQDSGLDRLRFPEVLELLHS